MWNAVIAAVPNVFSIINVNQLRDSKINSDERIFILMKQLHTSWMLNDKQIYTSTFAHLSVQDNIFVCEQMLAV